MDITDVGIITRLGGACFWGLFSGNIIQFEKHTLSAGSSIKLPCLLKEKIVSIPQNKPFPIAVSSIHHIPFCIIPLMFTPTSQQEYSKS